MKIHCIVCVLICQLMLTVPTTASGGFHLTGALLYKSTSEGALDLPTVSKNYRYNTNSADTAAPLKIVSIDTPAIANLAPVIADKSPINFLLNDGDNRFSFTSGGISNFASLSLFFTDTDGLANNSHNPSGAGNIIGDLVFVSQVNVSSSPTTSAAQGAMVQTYNPNGLASLSVDFNSAYGGAAYFVQDLQQVTVSHFSVDSGGNGTFTLRVSPLTITAVPEPATLGAMSVILCGACKLLRRRKPQSKQLKDTLA